MICSLQSQLHTQEITYQHFISHSSSQALHT